MILTSLPTTNLLFLSPLQPNPLKSYFYSLPPIPPLLFYKSHSEQFLGCTETALFEVTCDLRTAKSVFCPHPLWHGGKHTPHV